MKQAYNTKSILISSLVLTMVMANSCKKSKDMDVAFKPIQQETKIVIPAATEAPAYFIHQSEKLEIPAAVDLPVNLPGGNERVATYYATGIQKYKAQPKAGSDPVVYEWVLVAPEAVLFDATNKDVGTHTAGPTWQLYGGLDSIFGQHFTPMRTAPSPDPTSIPWLLLMPKTGTTATGIFANVSYIQRIATKGGKAPATPPVSASDVINVDYTAVYRFSKIN